MDGEGADAAAAPRPPRSVIPLSQDPLVPGRTRQKIPKQFQGSVRQFSRKRPRPSGSSPLPRTCADGPPPAGAAEGCAEPSDSRTCRGPRGPGLAAAAFLQWRPGHILLTTPEAETAGRAGPEGAASFTLERTRRPDCCPGHAPVAPRGSKRGGKQPPRRCLNPRPVKIS